MNRTVKGEIKRIDGLPWVGLPVYFRLISGSGTGTGSYDQLDASSYPSIVTRVFTDTSGRFSVSLWCNEEGKTPTVYSCQFQGERFSFTMPTGGTTDYATAIDISELRTRGVEPTATPVTNKTDVRQLFQPTSGQNIFILNTVSRYPHLSRFWINGIKYTYGIDYMIDGITVTWLGTIRLENTDTVEILY